MDITLVTVNSETGEVLNSNVLSNSGLGVFEEIRYATEDGGVFSKELIMKGSPFFDVVDERDCYDFIVSVDTRSSSIFKGYDKHSWRFYIKISDENYTYYSVTRILEDIIKAIFRGYDNRTIRGVIKTQVNKFYEDDDREIIEVESWN